MAAINKVILFGRLLDSPASQPADPQPRSLRYAITFAPTTSGGESAPLRARLLVDDGRLAARLHACRPPDFVYLEGHLTSGPNADDTSVVVDDIVVLKGGLDRAGGPTRPTSRDTYTGAIRWQAVADARWELETRHPGFDFAEDAALFTAGFGRAAVEQLELESTGLRLLLNDGTVTTVPDSDLRVWHAPVPSEGFRPECARFTEVPIGGRELARVLPPTHFVPLLHDVIGPGSTRIAFCIRSAGPKTLELTVYDPIPQDSDATSIN